MDEAHFRRRTPELRSPASKDVQSIQVFYTTIDLSSNASGAAIRIALESITTTHSWSSGRECLSFDRENCVIGAARDCKQISHSYVAKNHRHGPSDHKDRRSASCNMRRHLYWKRVNGRSAHASVRERLSAKEQALKSTQSLDRSSNM